MAAADDPVPDAVAVIEALRGRGEPLPVAVGVALCEAVTVADGVPLPEGDAEALAVGDGVLVGDGGANETTTDDAMTRRPAGVMPQAMAAGEP